MESDRLLVARKINERDDEEKDLMLSGEARLVEKQISKVSSFLKRSSILDREEMDLGMPMMRGFLALFWITTFLYVSTTLYKNRHEHWMGLSLELWNNSYKDFMALLLMIGLIYFYTYVCLPYQHLLRTAALDSRRTISRFICRQILQTTPLIMALFVSIYRRWPHLQTGSLLLFGISMGFKMQSFLIINESLDVLYHQNGKKCKGQDYPKNLSLSNFTLFIWYPTLIYQLQYPRIDRIRWTVLLERSFGVIVVFGMFYVVLSHYVHPVILKVDTQPFIDSLIDLIIPCLLSALLLFFLVFEYLLNWAAEVTRFADRKFYGDWWNSTDMAEFSRKWNMPVHKFLRYHIYSNLREWHGFDKGSAQFCTFLYSSLLHELVASFTAKKFKLWMFFMQMSQIPLIYLSSLLKAHRQPFVANLIWWLMIIIGIPLLVLLYSQ